MRQIPLAVKIVYSAFVAVLVPYYWATYTPWNFLYFCDVALIVTLVAMWTESALLISMQAVAILFPQALWVVDFLLRLVAGTHLTGMTGYMFDSKIPLFVRGLSSFHGWLPFLLVYLLLRLGYHRRAFKAQAACGVLLILICYFVAPAPPPPLARPTQAVNINYVYGMDDQHAQTAMAPLLWLASLIGITVVGFYVPTHVVLHKVCAQPKTSGRPVT